MTNPSAPSPDASGARRGLLVALTFLGFISLGLPDGLQGVAWPSLSARVGVGIDALGGLLAAFTVGYLIASFNSGRILAALGVGRLLAACGATTALSLLGYATTGSWPLLLACGLFLGAGGGAIDAGLNTYAAEHYSPRLLNWLHACYGVGATAGPALMAAVLGARWPWQAGYVIVGGAQLALAAGFALSRRLWDDHGPARAAEAAPPSPLGATLRLPATWLGAAIFLTYTGLEAGIGGWSYTLLTLGRGLDPALAGVWVSAYWGSLTAGRVVFGIIADRLGAANTLRVGIGGALAGAALFWLAPFPGADLLGLLVAGFALAPIFPTLIATTAGRVGQTHAANAIGVQISSAMLGAALLPGAIGLATGLGGVAVIGPGLALAALVLVALYGVSLAAGRPGRS